MCSFTIVDWVGSRIVWSAVNNYSAVDNYHTCLVQHLGVPLGKSNLVGLAVYSL